MRVLRYILEFIAHVCDFFRTPQDTNIKNNQCIVLRPDGSWILTQQNKLSKPAVSQPPPKPSYYMPRFSWDDSDLAGELLEPPDFFPHKDELKTKLEQCVDMDVISTYQHTRTSQGTYLLRIELPCSSEEYAQSYNQFKLFVRAMESKYNFKTLQQDRVTSKTSEDKMHVVVFEYDPRSKLF